MASFFFSLIPYLLLGVSLFSIAEGSQSQQEFNLETVQCVRSKGFLFNGMSVVELGATVEKNLYNAISKSHKVKSYVVVNSTEENKKFADFVLVNRIKNITLINTENFNFTENSYSLLLLNDYPLTENISIEMVSHFIKNAKNGYVRLTEDFSTSHAFLSEDILRLLLLNEKKGKLEKKVNSTVEKILSWSSDESKNSKNILVNKTAIKNSSAKNKSGITFSGGGRLGNKLIAYMKALWLAEKYGLTLYYPKFPFADQFVFSDLYPSLSNVPDFPNKHFLTDESEVLKAPDETLFEVHFRTPIRVNFEDPVFLNKLTTTLSPKNEVVMVVPPKNKITVAVHFRTGGDFDSLEAQKKAPLRFVPEGFYNEAIKTLCLIFKEIPLHFHIFTDDKNPLAIINRFQEQFASANVSFSCRESENSHKTNVIEDFSSIGQFDCLIAAQSSFSYMASKIGRTLITFKPRSVINQDAFEDRIIGDWDMSFPSNFKNQISCEISL